MPDNGSYLMERRRHPRTMVQMTVQGVRLDPECGDMVDTLHTVDLSRSGMGAHSDRAFYPGQRVVLCMPLSSSGGQRNIYATVIRCRPDSEGYRIGLEFDAASRGSWYGGPDAAAA